MSFWQSVGASVLSGLILALLLYWFGQSKVFFSFLSDVAKGTKKEMAPPPSAIVVSSSYRYDLAHCPYCIVIEGTLDKIRGLKEQDEYDIFYDDGRKVEMNGCDRWRRISSNDNPKQYFILAYLNSVFTDEEIVNETYSQEERHIAAKELVKVEKQGTVVRVAREDWEKVKKRETLNVFTYEQGTITGRPVQVGTSGDWLLIRLNRINIVVEG